MPPIELVIFDYGGVISVRLLDGLDRFETRMGYPPGSVTRLMFGESSRTCRRARTRPAATRPTARAADGEPHDFHLLEMGRLGLAEYLTNLVARAPEVLGRPLDFDAYREFTASTPVSIHWAVVHAIRRLRDEGVLARAAHEQRPRVRRHVAEHVPRRRAVPRRGRLERGRAPQARSTHLRADLRAGGRRSRGRGLPRRQRRQHRGRRGARHGDRPRRPRPRPALVELDAILDRRGVRRR